MCFIVSLLGVFSLLLLECIRVIHAYLHAVLIHRHHLPLSHPTLVSMIPIFPYSISISPSSIRLDSFAYATYTNPILRSFRLETHASATRLSARRRLRSALARRYTLPLIRRACRPFLLITTIFLLTSNVSA